MVMPPGPPGLARLPVAAGSGAVGRGGTTLSDGRNRGAAGRVGIAGTEEVPGALGSSILSRMLGGTIRPGAGFALGGSTGGAAATCTGGSSGGSGVWAGGSGISCGSEACATCAGGSTGSSTRGEGGASSVGGSSTTGAGVTSAGAAAGLVVFTRRGGASVGAAGFAGSTFFAPGVDFFMPGLAAGPSANMSPPGSVIPRSRDRRSTNWRATTSSSELEALFSSIPCARFNSASTSWLLVLRSSATL